MAARKQQTFAKLQRERKVKERRQMKLEKKQAAAARKLAVANGELPIDSEDQQDAEAAGTATSDPTE
jgi:hypothetical protein